MYNKVKKENNIKPSNRFAFLDDELSDGSDVDKVDKQENPENPVNPVNPVNPDDQEGNPRHKYHLATTSKKVKENKTNSNFSHNFNLVDNKRKNFNDKKTFGFDKKNSRNGGENKLVSNIEEEMFAQYYGRKVYKNWDNKKNSSSFGSGNPTHQTHQTNSTYLSNAVQPSFSQSQFQTQLGMSSLQTDDGFKHVGKRRDKQIIECKYKDLEPDIMTLTMGNYFKVLAHHNDDQNWDYNSYHNICTLKKWEDIAKLFNTLDNVEGESKYTDFDIFIMKNEISPMWEDIENRNGSICSIKVDSIKDGYKILRQLLIYNANNTLMEFSPESWDKINGLSFSPKRMDNLNNDESYCVIIKIWFKQNYGNNCSIDKYMNPELQDLLRKYSIKVKSVKPEY